MVASVSKHLIWQARGDDAVRDGRPAFVDKETLKPIGGADRAAMPHWEAQVGNANLKVTARSWFAVVGRQSCGEFSRDRPARGGPRTLEAGA